MSSPLTTTSRARLSSLYSDFSPQKTSNPTSYTANVEWWRRAFEWYLSEADWESDTLVLHYGPRMIENLRMEGVGKPIGLGGVISELLPSSSSSSTSVLYPLQTFLSLPHSIYTRTTTRSYITAVPSFVLSYAVGKPLWWALEQVGVVGEDSIASSILTTVSSFRGGGGGTSDHFGDYVVLSLVERAGERIIQRQRDKAGVGPGDALYTLTSFRKEFASCLAKGVMSEGDMKVLLKYLERDKDVLVVDKDVIKFIETYSLSERIREVTAVDRGIIELKTAVDSLHQQVDNIHTRMEDCKSKALEATRQKLKPLAMSYLRSRHQLEELVKKRLGALENLEATLLQVEAAAQDIQIVNAYSSSTATLRAILSHPSLQRESVEKTMEAMAEANADAKEMDDAIRLGGDVAVGSSDVIDEDELQAELEGLIQEAQGQGQGRTEKEVGDRLGQVSATPLHAVRAEEEERRRQLVRS